MCHVFVFAAHPWVREDGNALEIPIDISVLHNLRQFVKFSRFKQFALRVIYNKHIYDRVISRINKSMASSFRTSNLSGFTQALASTLSKQELAGLKDQFDAIDVDKNGTISLEEMRHVSGHLRMHAKHP